MTTITFNGEEKELKALYGFIDDKEANEKDGLKTDFGNTWLGNYLVRAGLDWHDYRCRGSVCYIEELHEGNGAFSVQTETAWEPMVNMWAAIVNKIAPGIEIIYSAEECGNGIYWTNDPACVNRYIVDIYDEDCLDEKIVKALGWDEYDDVSEKDLREGLLEVFPDDVNLSTKELIEKLTGLTDDDGISILQWEFVPIDEAD
jgi:hypothetical protein